MGDVTGPISTLPGRRHELPDGAMCDEHPDRPAVARIQGETDSFGCEMWDCCKECLDEIRNEGPDIGECDWCHAKEVALRPRRDIDEGSHGRVYYVCKPCVDRDEAAIKAELDYYDDGRDDIFDDD